MGPGTLLLVIVAGIVAFALGSRWRHMRHSRSTYRVAVAATRKARSVNRLALRGLIIVGVVTAAYLFGVVRVTMTGQDKGQPPASVPHTGPSAAPPGSPVPPRPSASHSR